MPPLDTQKHNEKSSQKPKEKSEIKKTSDSLKVLLGDINDAEVSRTEALKKSVHLILNTFIEKKSQYPATKEEMFLTKELLEKVRSDLKSFSILREELLMYFKTLSKNDFKKMKTRIIKTLESLNEEEFDVFLNFLSGVEDFGSGVLGFFSGRSQKEVVIDGLSGFDKAVDFGNKLLGSSDSVDKKELQSQLKNAIELVNLMLKR